MAGAAAVLVAAAVVVPLAEDGGWGAGPRWRFGALALAAAATAALADPPRARRLVRAPIVWVLAALGALGAVSAAWTVGIADEALRWGLVTAGYGALVLAVAVLVRDRRGAVAAAALVAAAAVGAAAAGLVAAALTHTPWALREAGLWRPAATLEYPPALALLVVSALPALLTAMAAARRGWPAGLAGLGGAVAGATLALASSRTQLAFALAVGGAALALPARTTGAPRAAMAVALAHVAATGLGAYAVVGGYVPKTPPPDGGARLLALGAVVAGAALAWPLLRLALRRGLPAAALAALLLAAGGAGAVAKPPPRLISSGFAEPAAQRAKRAPARAGARELHPVRDRLLHGRLEIWADAARTFGDRPLHGGGADAYLFASGRYQDTRTVFFAHDLPLELAAELGVAGLLLALGLYAAALPPLRRARTGPAAWLLGPAAIAFLAANLVDWPWHLAVNGAVWAVAFGAILGTGGATRRRL